MGQEFEPQFGAPELEDLLQDGSANDIRRITLSYTSANLSSANDGEYTIRVMRGYDVAGNVAGDDREPDAAEWKVNIR